MDKNLVYKMKFWNFELITILPSTPSPSSVSRRDGVVVSPSATRRSLAAPPALPHPWVLPKALDPSTRRYLPTHTSRMAARRATATMRRAVSCAFSPPPLCPRSLPCLRPHLALLPSLDMAARPLPQLLAGKLASRPWRRRPRPPRRAPTPPILDPSQAPNWLPHLPWNLPSPAAPSPPYRAAAAAK